MRQTSFKTRALGALLLVGLWGCVPPTPLVIGPAFSQARQGSAGPSAGRVLHFNAITDERLDKTALGSVGGRPVRAPGHTEDWLNNIMLGLEAYGFKVQLPGTGPAPAQAMGLEAKLLTAWVSSSNSSKSANVVMAFRYHKADGSVVERQYRGSEVKVNWNSGDDEIVDLVDSAFTKVLGQVATDPAL